MVINTYNPILQLEPDHAARWRRSRRSTRRWAAGTISSACCSAPSTCRRTRDGEVAPAAAHRGAVDRQVRQPQPGGQAARGAVRDRSGRPDTVGELRDIYTQAPLVAGAARPRAQGARAAGEPGGAARAKLGEMAKLAAERLGDAREAIAIWNRVLETRRDDAEALQRSPGSTSARSAGRRSSRSCSARRSDKAPTQGAVALLEKLGALYSERLGAPGEGRRRRTGDRRASRPSHEGAAHAARAVRGGGRFAELEALYAGRASRRSCARSCSSVAERVRRRAERARCGSTARRRDRAARAQVARARGQGVRAHPGDRPENQAAAHALVPIYARGEKWARLLATYEIILGAAQPAARRRRGARAASRDRRAVRGEARLEEAGVRLGGQGVSAAARRCGSCRRTSSGSPPRPRRGKSWPRSTRPRSRKETDDAAQGRALSPAGAHRAARGSHKPDEARKCFEEVLARAPEDAEALQNLEQISHAGGELQGAARDLRGARRAPERSARGASSCSSRSPGSRRSSSAIRWRRRRPIARSSRPTRRRRRRRGPARAREAERGARRLRAAWPTCSSGSWRSSPSGDEDTRLELSQRLGEMTSSSSTSPIARSRTIATAFALSSSHKPTVAALERWLKARGQGATIASRSRACSCRSTSSGWRSARRARARSSSTRSRSCAPRRRIRRPSSPRCAGSCDLSATQLGDAARAYGYGGTRRSSARPATPRTAA